MAKKTNRPKAKPTAKPKPIVEPVESVVETPIETAPPVPRAPRQPKLTRSQAASERLEDEYGYITGDLRRVFILAAAMFALLIAVNLAFSLLG